MTSFTPMPTPSNLQLIEAVPERFEGARVSERRRWSDGFKAQAVAASLEPEINVSALARRLGVAPAQLFGWRKAYLKTQVGELASVGQEGTDLEIKVGEVTIRVGSNIGEEALRRILRVVRSL